MDNSIFVHIKYLADGLDVKLTHKGLVMGAHPLKARDVAMLVKIDHESQTKQRGHTINATLLGAQIYAHAAAYIGCEKSASMLTPDSNDNRAVSIGKGVAGVPVHLACPSLQKHANPVNVSWQEIDPAGSLDKKVNSWISKMKDWVN